MPTSAPDFVFLTCTATVAASDPIGAIDNVTITDDPSVTGVIRFLIPQGQTWVFEDLYISASANAGTSDPLISVFKGGDRLMGRTPPLSNLLVTNNSRPPYANRKIGFRGGEELRMSTLATVANDATADSISFGVRVKVT